MEKLEDKIRMAFYRNLNSKIHYDSSRLLRDKKFLESINDKNIDLLEERIVEEITRQKNILETIENKNPIVNCIIEDHENYFKIDINHYQNSLRSHIETYMISDKGEQLLLPMSDTKEILTLDTENFLQIEKDKNDIITTVLHYALQEDDWKLVKVFKNMGISHIIPHYFNSNGTVYSQNVVGFRNLKDTNMLYNFKKQQVMIDDYSEASEDLDTFDKHFYPNAIRISKYGNTYQLDYLVNREGQLYLEFKIGGQENAKIEEINSNENQRDYINRIIENCNNRPKNNRNKVFQKTSDSNN